MLFRSFVLIFAELNSIIMKRMHIVTGLLLCLAAMSCVNKESVESSVIPVPREVKLSRGSFAIDEQVAVRVEASQEDKALLQTYIKASPLAIAKGQTPIQGSIVLEQVDSIHGLTRSEGYRLIVDRKSIKVSALSGAGLFYGLQTLLQMIDEHGHVRCCVVEDEPRFEYRGMMLDVSRHFYGVDCVKRQIDVMAAYKLNHLHLHLTDAAAIFLILTLSDSMFQNRLTGRNLCIQCLMINAAHFIIYTEHVGVTFSHKFITIDPHGLDHSASDGVSNKRRFFTRYSGQNKFQRIDMRTLFHAAEIKFVWDPATFQVCFHPKESFIVRQMTHGAVEHAKVFIHRSECSLEGTVIVQFHQDLSHVFS